MQAPACRTGSLQNAQALHIDLASIFASGARARVLDGKTAPPDLPLLFLGVCHLLQGHSHLEHELQSARSALGLAVVS